jgi:hypothetical protein
MNFVCGMEVIWIHFVGNLHFDRHTKKCCASNRMVIGVTGVYRFDRTKPVLSRNLLRYPGKCFWLWNKFRKLQIPRSAFINLKFFSKSCEPLSWKDVKFHKLSLYWGSAFSHKLKTALSIPWRNADNFDNNMVCHQRRFDLFFLAFLFFCYSPFFHPRKIPQCHYGKQKRFKKFSSRRHIHSLI